MEEEVVDHNKIKYKGIILNINYLCYEHNTINCNKCGYSGNGKYLCYKHNDINCNKCAYIQNSH